MRKLFLVILSFFVLSVPVFAYSYPSLPPDADNYENYFIAYSKKYDTYVCMIYNGQLDSSISYGSNGSRTHTLNTTDGYYYKYINNGEWSKVFSHSTPHVVVYYHGNDGVVVEKLTGLIISNEDDLTQNAIDTLNFLGYEVGESLSHLKEVTEIPEMVGKAAGSIISFAALPILIIILGILLIPRLVHYFRL